MNPHDFLSGGFVPKLMKKSAGSKQCCIFRIPDKLKNNNHEAYEPRIVSIGPYHHGKEHLQIIQEHKHRLFEIFMAKAKKLGVDSEDLIEAVSMLEKDIRESYSESLYSDKDDDSSSRKKLIEMMVLDGCFILMLLLGVADIVGHPQNDPIFTIPWILPAIRSDLLLLENQVPFFLLQTILDRSMIESSSKLNELTFVFFNFSIPKPKDFWSQHLDLKAHHLLDLIRMTFMPPISKENERVKKNLLDYLVPKICMPREENRDQLDSTIEEGNPQSNSEENNRQGRPFLKLISSARKLQLKGIKFKLRESAETPLDITHKGKLIQIPQLILDDFLVSVLLNFVSFEQFYYYSEKHITSYIVFMGCLLRSEADAIFLSDEGILENYYGSGVSEFFKVIGKDVTFDIHESYLADVFEGVTKYISRGYHVQWAEFMHTHFESPWTALSSGAALTLVILTIIQAFFAAYAYFHPPN